jgi:hypothetical protein
MKNLPTFETFVNESVLNEASAANKANVIAAKFLDDLERELKIDALDYQMLKMTPKGFAVRVVVKDANDKVRKWVQDYKDEHENDLGPSIPMSFSCFDEIPGHKQFWPADNKKFFDIIRESSEPINEDAMTAILMLQAAMVGGQLALLANKVDFHPIDDLKDWWREHKRDKAVQSILDKLKDDQDVIEFLQLPKSKQEGQWKKLIAPKLNADELKYINSISRDRVKTGKI